ncbi:MAG: hypothetical protein M3281_06690 [Chloroflexota bacterium]|nr:hypothetical protein [Chloroflexota bacterium]
MPRFLRGRGRWLWWGLLVLAIVVVTGAGVLVARDHDRDALVEPSPGVEPTALTPSSAPGATPTATPTDPSSSGGTASGPSGGTASGSSGGSASDPSGTTASQTSQASGSPASSGEEPSRRPERPRNRVVEWILGLAPGGGVDLPEENAYQELQHDCVLPPRDGSDDPYFTALSAQERRLYEGAAAACRAAFYDEPDRWQVAEAALRQIDAMGADFTCLGDVAYAALRDLVAVHTTDPTARLVRGDGPGRGPACPRVISLEPDHGAASGGYRIRLVGEHLPSTSIIHFGDVDLTVQTDGVSASVIVPPAPVDMDWSAGEGYVQVWVEGWYMEVFNTPAFRYEREAQPRPSPSTGADPTASPGG